MKVSELRTILADVDGDLDVAIAWDGHVEFFFERVDQAGTHRIYDLFGKVSGGPLSEERRELVRIFVLMGMPTKGMSRPILRG